MIGKPVGKILAIVFVIPLDIVRGVYLLNRLNFIMRLAAAIGCEGVIFVFFVILIHDNQVDRAIIRPHIIVGPGDIKIANLVSLFV